jgi:hypothetical protein
MIAAENGPHRPPALFLHFTTTPAQVGPGVRIRLPPATSPLRTSLVLELRLNAATPDWRRCSFRIRARPFPRFLPNGVYSGSRRTWNAVVSRRPSIPLAKIVVGCRRFDDGRHRICRDRCSEAQPGCREKLAIFRLASLPPAQHHHQIHVHQWRRAWFADSMSRSGERWATATC